MAKNPLDGIGRMLANLMTLELVLRLFLYDTVGPTTPGVDFHALAPGDHAPENPITNYDSLRHLIGKTNAELQKRGLPDRIDASVVQLRDSLAHGRLAASQPTGPWRLVKYSRPLGGQVQVTVAIEVTDQWISAQISRTFNAIQDLVRVAGRLGLPSFPEQ